MMNCLSCGSQLPPGAKVCPNCGTLTPANYSKTRTSYDPTLVAYPPNPQAGSSPSYDPTLAASPSPPPPPPSTAYGSSAYPPVPTSPGSRDPYSAMPPPPPPPYSSGAPQVGSYPFPAPAPTPAGAQGQVSRRRLPGGTLVLLLVLAALLIGGGALIYSTAVYQPAQQRAQATATAVVQSTATAHAQAQINATATAAAENPYTHSGTLVLSDPLSDNSKGVNWAQDPINCGFLTGAYHVKAPDAKFYDDCLANNTDYSNFAFEVQMQIIQGDSGGIIFRDQDTAQAYRNYALDIYQNGSYNLNIMIGSSNTTLASNNSTAIKQGLNQSNLIAVIAQGNTPTVYANHQQLASVTDSTLSKGRIGLEAAPLANNGHPTEIVFSQAKVWTL